MQSARVRTVIELVSAMSDTERVELRDELDLVLDPPADWESAWNDELSLRIGEVERGEARLLDEDEFFDDEPR
ncbi:MAG: hypothetical protein U0359_00105 [Byssovorax sp.]